MITKGKWTNTGDGVIVAEDSRQIASVFPRDREANAQLIAAAPDLYEALKYIIRELDKADIIKADSIFMVMPNKALVKAEVKK